MLCFTQLTSLQSANTWFIPKVVWFCCSVLFHVWIYPCYLSFPQMFVALIFWYQFYCGFSGSAMIDQWYLIFFNLMFSAFPQLITGTLDKDVSAETLQQLPQLYVNGQNSEVRSTRAFVPLILVLTGIYWLDISCVTLQNSLICQSVKSQLTVGRPL